MIFNCIVTRDVERAMGSVNSVLNNAETPNVSLFLNGVMGAGFGGLVCVGGSTKNIGAVAAMDFLYRSDNQEFMNDDWLLFLHDDTIIKEPGFDEILEAEMAKHPACKLFGFGGALGIGDPDLYQKPYVLTQLARRDYISNMEHAEAHGSRVQTATQVAVLDGFAMGVRMDFLRQIDGWSWFPKDLPFHCYDVALSLMAKRHGYETWMVPIRCHHLGGQTSTKTNFLSDFGRTESEIHSSGHDWLYKEFRDVLPILQL